MVLTYPELIEAGCIFLLIDNNIISSEIRDEFKATIYHQNHEMFVLLNWMLMRWILLRKHKFHLPKRRPCENRPQCINLTNLINSNST